MAPPLAVDIDGTLTRPDASLDPRVIDPLRDYEGPVVVTTGKVLPNAVALCHFVGIPERCVAETGAIVLADDELTVVGDGAAADAFAADYVDAVGSLGWGDTDVVNRWREVEVAVNLDHDRDTVDRIAAEHGLEVLDTGYAYHVKSPDVDKGQGLERAASLLEIDTDDVVAIGDSENDVHTFRVAGESYAVANADSAARDAADHVTEGTYADGFLEALDAVT